MILAPLVLGSILDLELRSQGTDVLCERISISRDWYSASHVVVIMFHPINTHLQDIMYFGRLLTTTVHCRLLQIRMDVMLLLIHCSFQMIRPVLILRYVFCDFVPKRLRNCLRVFSASYLVLLHRIISTP